MGEEELDPGLQGYSDSGSDFHDLPPPGLPEGVQKSLIKPTSGPLLKRPQEGDEVVAHYAAFWARGGEPVASTRAGDPVSFVLGGGEVLRGLEVAVATMRLGEVAAFVVPPAYAEGSLCGTSAEAQVPGALRLEVELVDWISRVDLFEDGAAVKRTMRRPDDRRRPIIGQECLFNCRLEPSSGALPSSAATLEYKIGGGAALPGPLGEMSSALLDRALLSMRRGELAQLRCAASCFYNAAAPAEGATGGQEVVCELELLEFLETADVSFERDRSVMKRTLRSRDAWEACQDAGRCTMSVASVRAGEEVLVSDRTLEFVIGNGEVCDALECAAVSMRKGEVAVVTCSNEHRCQEPRLDLTGAAGLTFHLEVTRYEAGPSEAAQTAEEKLDFFAARKEAATALFQAGRYALAAHRFGRIYELLGYIDDYRGVRGGQARKQRVDELKRACLLNRALCLLKLPDFRRAVLVCDLALDAAPRDAKALFRRAQAHLGLGNCHEAMRDARAAAEAEPRSAEVRRLLAEVKERFMEEAGETQPLYAKMCSGLGRLPHPLDVD